MKYLIFSLFILAAAGCGPGRNQPAAAGFGQWDGAEYASAYKLLAESTVFRLGGIGFAGSMAPEQVALCRIIKQDNASEILESLYSNGTLPGKLYSLLGFRFVDRARFEELSPKLKKNTDKIEAQAGCVFFKQTVRSVVEMMGSGDYDGHIERGLEADRAEKKVDIQGKNVMVCQFGEGNI